MAGGAVHAMAYKEHPAFRLPSGETKIWRYMDFTKLVSLLEKRALYFASVEKMSEFDPFEGLYTRANIAVENLRFEDIPEYARTPGTLYADRVTFESFVKKALPEFRRFVKQNRPITYVNCWHARAYESAAMWKTYLKTDEGIAIQSTVDRLKAAVSNYDAFEVNIGEVSYVDFETFPIPMDNMAYVFMHKRRSFDYEHELRAFIWGGQGSKMHWDKTESAPPGLLVSVDLDVLIDKMYASPTAEPWFVELLRSVCARYRLEKEVVQSDLASKGLY